MNFQIQPKHEFLAGRISISRGSYREQLIGVAGVGPRVPEHPQTLPGHPHLTQQKTLPLQIYCTQARVVHLERVLTFSHRIKNV